MLVSDPGPETPVDERKRNEHRTSNVQHRILNEKNKFGLKNREP